MIFIPDFLTSWGGGIAECVRRTSAIMTGILNEAGCAVAHDVCDDAIAVPALFPEKGEQRID